MSVTYCPHVKRLKATRCLCLEITGQSDPRQRPDESCLDTNVHSTLCELSCVNSHSTVFEPYSSTHHVTERGTEHPQVSHLQDRQRNMCTPFINIGSSIASCHQLLVPLLGPLSPVHHISCSPTAVCELSESCRVLSSEHKALTLQRRSPATSQPRNESSLSGLRNKGNEASFMRQHSNERHGTGGSKRS